MAKSRFNATNETITEPIEPIITIAPIHLQNLPRTERSTQPLRICPIAQLCAKPKHNTETLAGNERYNSRASPTNKTSRTVALRIPNILHFDRSVAKEETHYGAGMLRNDRLS